MIFLFWFCLGLFLLYWWLMGHWFARVVMFLVLAAVFALAAGQLQYGDSAERLISVAIGAALAWPVSGLPIRVLRQSKRPA